ncbi:MAG: RNase adapter RapZ [Bacteroidales bacterium]
MIKDELLRLLFRDFTGKSPESLTVLPKSGSDRIYCRMVRGDFSVLGVWNPSRKENDAFTGFAESFIRAGLRVPRVYQYLPEEMVYLTEDLGDLDLCMWVEEKRKKTEGEKEIVEMYKSILKELIRFQFDADREIDYNLCYPRRKFDRNSVMWDLNYFKYMFLKLSGTPFNEQLLEEDFVKLADEIEQVWSDGFLYRDFQSRNIMIKEGIPWFIDFQGGRKGAPHYDVASLLLDPYVELGREMHDELLGFYFSLLNQRMHTEKDAFINEYRMFGIVRLLQALGAYGFRGLYERKPNFTSSIPPAVRQLEKLFAGEGIRKKFPELLRIVENLYTRWASTDTDHRPKPEVIIESFSFEKGIPETFTSDGGFMFDCRHILTPENTEVASNLGNNNTLADYFDDRKDVQDLTENAYRIIAGALSTEGIGKVKTLRVCFGCSSGKHVSVYCAEKVAELLRQDKLAEVIVFHHQIR